MPKEKRSRDSRPDQTVTVDVVGIIAASVNHGDADVPREQQHAHDRFTEQAMQRRLAHRGETRSGHEKSEHENTGVQRVCLNGEKADDEVD